MVDPNHFNTTHKLDAVQLKPVRMQPLHSKGQSKRPTGGGEASLKAGAHPQGVCEFVDDLLIHLNDLHQCTCTHI